MDIIQMSRDLGKAIQKEESYIKLRVMQQQCDEDKDLQELIGNFNLKRIAISNETSKEDRNDEKLQELNAELRHVYAEIMKNEKMTAYNEAKTELDTLLNRVMSIVSKSADGEDPDTADYAPTCSGSCSSCGGCH